MSLSEHFNYNDQQNMKQEKEGKVNYDSDEIGKLNDKNSEGNMNQNFDFYLFMF